MRAWKKKICWRSKTCFTKSYPFSFCQQESPPRDSQTSTLPSSSQDVCSTSHGMTSSELGQVIRADHDYIELLVKVKAEVESEDEEQEIPEEIDIKEEIIDSEEKKPDLFDNLATLAEVSLATAGLPGQPVDKSLKREIDQARAKIKQTILPVTPEMSSKRTMQVIFVFLFTTHNSVQLFKAFHKVCSVR